jgi:hypothetical protein
MSSIYAASSTPGTPDRALTVRAGLIGGLAGGIIIWIYEALVWVGVQHLMPLAGIPRNATGLVFGKQVQEQLGTAAYFVGTGIHFLFALAWGRSPEIHTPRRGHGFRTRAELVIGPRFARTRWRAPE